MIVRLVACQSCHAQLDVTDVKLERVTCGCGASVDNRPPTPLNVPVHRCSACGGALGEAASLCGFCGVAVVRDPSRLGLVCPECFARTVERGRFCTACGIAIRPQPVQGEGAGLACPACEQDLVGISLDGIAIHECRGCGGTWVRNGDFDDIVERVQTRAAGRASQGLATPHGSATIDAAAPVAYRSCPECKQIMHRRNFGRVSGVVVDWCKEHGTWLDAAELETVAAFVQGGGLDDRGKIQVTTSTTVTTSGKEADLLLRQMRAGTEQSFIERLFVLLT